MSALAMASYAGHLQIVHLLLMKHADLYVKSVSGASVLHLACMGGHAPIVHALLTAKANALTPLLNILILLGACQR